MNLAVSYRRDLRMAIPLGAWPLHGLVGSIAWQFDGRRLRIVRVTTFDHEVVARWRTTS